jgi:hypothetical protein
VDIRAAELTADRLDRTVRISPGVPTVIVGPLVSIRQRVRRAAPAETETQLEVEIARGHRIKMGFNSIHVVELVDVPRPPTG